uniref:AHH domain-containing protein n=3 Tax=Gelidibacter sp. TaxID=2018083 RepID=UPI00404B414F
MKKLKNYLKHLFLITALIFTAISCQKEDDATLNETNVSKQKVKIETVNKAFIDQHQGIKGILEVINVKNNTIIDNTFQREVYSENFDLYIDTDSAIYIENDNSHSFTFSAYSNDNDNILNIVLFFDPNSQEYIVNKVEYTFNNQDLSGLVEGNITRDAFGKITFMRLDGFNTDSLFNRENNSTGIHTRSDGTCYFIENVVRIFDGDTVYYEYDEVTIPCSSGGENVQEFENTDGTGGGSGFIDIIYVYNPNTDQYEEWYPDNSTGTGSGIGNNNNNGNNTQGGFATLPYIDYAKHVSKTLGVAPTLSNAQADIYEWVMNPNNIGSVKDIFSFIVANDYSEESKTFALELFTIMLSETVVDSNVLNFTLEAFNQDKIYNNFDYDFLSSVNQYMAIDTSDESLTDPITIHILMKMALIRALNPDICAGLQDWQCDIKVFWEATKDVVHIVLDGIGLVPVVGEVADLINGGLYLLEGDGVNATLSFAATVPIAGWTATGTKYAIKIVDASQTASTIVNKVQLTWKVVGNSIEFGNRNQLRKVLGLTDNALQAHHIMPWAWRNHDVVQKAAKSGNAFHMNEALNGIAVAAWRNQPNHTAYSNLIKSKLDLFSLQNPNATPQECYNFLSNLIQDIRNWVINNPNSHLNNLVLP